VKRERPVNLDLFKFKFPVMAIVSVLHRISGVVIFLFIPFMLYILHQSLISQTSFEAIQNCLQHPVAKIFVGLMLAAVLFHLIAGIRHLMMDLGFAEGRQAGRFTAWLVISIAAIVIILMGVWLW
jgi:succinate dehydrogenase / fumarate reductase, cytochrome b subunit